MIEVFKIPTFNDRLPNLFYNDHDLRFWILFLLRAWGGVNIKPITQKYMYIVQSRNFGHVHKKSE